MQKWHINQTQKYLSEIPVVRIDTCFVARKKFNHFHVSFRSRLFYHNGQRISSEKLYIRKLPNGQPFACHNLLGLGQLYFQPIFAIFRGHRCAFQCIIVNFRTQQEPGHVHACSIAKSTYCSLRIDFCFPSGEEFNDWSLPDKDWRNNDTCMSLVILSSNHSTSAIQQNTVNTCFAWLQKEECGPIGSLSF